MPNWASMRQNLGGSSSGQPPAADSAAPAYQPPQTSQYQPPQPQQNESCNLNSPKAQNFGMQNEYYFSTFLKMKVYLSDCLLAIALIKNFVNLCNFFYNCTA